MAKFYGIGVGPGDKELLTLKAVRVLSGIDVLLLPEAKAQGGSIAYEISKDYINSDAELVYFEFPMVTDAAVINEAGRKASELVSRYVKSGKNIAFITLGDPSVYSTYGYIVKNLEQNIEVETIPGITSFCAAAAKTSRQLVEGDEILSIIPATAPTEKIEQAVSASGGTVFMKVYRHGDKVAELLEREGLLKSSVLVKRCGFADCCIEKDVNEGLKKDKQYLSVILARGERE